MVYRVVLLIWALVLGIWLWEHGWHQAGQVALGLVVAMGFVVVYAFWPLVFAWVIRPRHKHRGHTQATTRRFR